MKVPKARKLKNGTWFIQLRLNGKSIPVSASTEKACTRKAELLKAEYRSGKRTIRKELDDYTLQEIINKYLNRNKSILSASTYRTYSVYSKSRFKAYLNKPISKIDYQQMINDELQNFSEKTVKNGWSLVHAALIDNEFPAPSVKLAKVPVNEIAFLQPDEIKLFIAELKDKPYEIPLLLELHGLRLSEVRALTWDKIDLKHNIITVQGAMVRGINGNVHKKTNKNDTSTRKVPIMIPRLKDVLQSADKQNEYLCSNAPQTLLDDVKRVCKNAGITVVTNHGLRHSFASLGYYLGISERQLMQWGGWADYHTMHKIYIRLAAVSEKESIAKIQNFYKQNAN